MTGQTWLRIDKAFLDKSAKEAQELSNSEIGEDDGKGQLTYNFDESTVEIEEIDEASSSITIRSSTAIGDVYLTAELSIESLICLIEVATKKLNKVKTVLEAVK